MFIRQSSQNLMNSEFHRSSLMADLWWKCALVTQSVCPSPFLRITVRILDSNGMVYTIVHLFF